MLLKEIEADPRRFSRNDIAAAYAALGDNDETFALRFNQIERGDPSRNLLASILPCDSLHRDPPLE